MTSPNNEKASYGNDLAEAFENGRRKGIEEERARVNEIIDNKIMEQDASGMILEKMADEFQVPLSVMCIRFLEMHLEDVKTFISTPPITKDEENKI